MNASLAADTLSDQPPYVFALLVLGILLVTASMLIGLRNRKKAAASQPSARDTLERAKQREGLKRDLEALAVEIEELARRVGTQLDNKAARLEKLMDDAESTLARLDHARTNLLSPPTHAPPSEPGRVDPEPGETKVDPTDPSRVGSPDTRSGAGENDTSDRLPADAYRLADQGLSPDQIAKSTGEPIGKIELILALRKSQP